jgi:hypothetical protein
MISCLPGKPREREGATTGGFLPDFFAGGSISGFAVGAPVRHCPTFLPQTTLLSYAKSPSGGLVGNLTYPLC